MALASNMHREGIRWRRDEGIYHEMLRFPAFSDYFVQDLMLAIRSARRRPAFTAVLLAALILGIGLTTSIFSVFYGVLLRPLLFRDPSRLVLVKQSLPEVVPFPINMPPADALEVARSRAFATVRSSRRARETSKGIRPNGSTLSGRPGVCFRCSA